MASIEDAAEGGERADALVSGLLDRVMRQRRSGAAARDYRGALARGAGGLDVQMRGRWAGDAQRGAEAGIQGKLALATKPELAVAKVRRLVKAGVRVLWAAADEVYGRSGEFRAALRALDLAYVVIIPCDYRVALAKNKVIRADQAIAGAVFERRSCRNRTKSPRYAR